MKILDDGHSYELKILDAKSLTDEYCRRQTVTFVKRHDPANPNRFPGNKESHPGTTSQNLLRVLLNRTRFLQKQKWCIENVVVIKCLQIANWLYEFRAARRHGRFYKFGLKFAETTPMCETCGHTICEHKVVD